MMISVRLFAAVRENVDTSVLEVELPPDATIAKLRATLIERLPHLSGLLQRSAFAVDQVYVDDSQRLNQGAEVACIPPVSGG